MGTTSITTRIEVVDPDAIISYVADIDAGAFEASAARRAAAGDAGALVVTEREGVGVGVGVRLGEGLGVALGVGAGVADASAGVGVSDGVAGLAALDVVTTGGADDAAWVQPATSTQAMIAAPGARRVESGMTVILARRSVADRKPTSASGGCPVDSGAFARPLDRPQE